MPCGKNFARYIIARVCSCPCSRAVLSAPYARRRPSPRRRSVVRGVRAVLAARVTVPNNATSIHRPGTVTAPSSHCVFETTVRGNPTTATPGDGRDAPSDRSAAKRTRDETRKYARVGGETGSLIASTPTIVITACTSHCIHRVHARIPLLSESHTVWYGFGVNSNRVPSHGHRQVVIGFFFSLTSNQPCRLYFISGFQSRRSLHSGFSSTFERP